MDILIVVLIILEFILLPIFGTFIMNRLDQLMDLTLITVSKEAKETIQDLAKKEAIKNKEVSKEVHVSGGVKEEIDRYASIKKLKEVPPDEDEMFEKAKED